MTVAKPEELLRQLAAGNPAALGMSRRAQGLDSALDRATRALVQLSALLSVGAPTDSLRWAVETACATGVGDAALIQVLITAAPIAGAVGTVAAAPRLALALDIDVAVDGWDGT